ncbi:sn-glycerol-3-phosphate import ATP-binding protein UgpC [compost metagenome]
MRVEIKRLHQSLKNTMIYVTHDQIEALTLADRIAVMKSGVIQQLADPMTIYNAPENLFVAGFIGSPSMNFFRGELQLKDGRAFVYANGVDFDVSAYPSRGPFKDGQKVVLGVRPEHVRVDEAPNGHPSHQAVVDIEEPMGADNLLWLKLAGQSMSVRIGGQRRYKPGTAVTLSFDMAVASIFDATSENRL